jgi:hypothetical protein
MTVEPLQKGAVMESTAPPAAAVPEPPKPPFRRVVVFTSLPR